MRIFATIAIFAATPVLAVCPDVTDLANGIRVTETDGAVNIFFTIEDGLAQNDGTASGGYTYRNILAHGTHLIELGDTENGAYITGTRRVVDYAMSTYQMPIPSPSSKWDVDTIVDNGGEYAERQTQSWGSMATIQIGDCTYDMIPGKLSYTNRNATVFEGLHYLPALEISLLHSYQTQGEPASIYTAAKIEAVQ